MSLLRDAAKIAANARKIADALDALPAGIEAPTHFTVDYQPAELAWLLFGDDDHEQQKATAAAIIRAVGGKWDKDPGVYFGFDSCTESGVKLHISVSREAVCKRVVTGTTEVTKSVTDPTAPLVEVTETVETVEWVCEPLLAEVSS